MSSLQPYIILLIVGLISCNSPERNSEKLTIKEDFNSNQKAKDTTLMNIKITDTQSNIQKGDTVLLSLSQSKKKRIYKYDEAVAVSETKLNLCITLYCPKTESLRSIIMSECQNVRIQ